MNELFRKIAHKTSQAIGSPIAFIIALLVVVIWLVSGPLFGFSDTWQLVINTGTTIVTFLVVFMIQNTQNRDSKAIQLKLDELLRAVGEARNSMVDLEDLSDAELERLEKEFREFHARVAAEERESPTKTSEEMKGGSTEAEREEAKKLKLNPKAES